MARDGRPRASGTRSAHCLNHSLGSTEMHWETNVSHIGWLATIWTWPALWFHSSMHAWKHGLSNSLNIYYAPAVIQAEPGTRGAAVKDTGVSPLYSLLGAHSFPAFAHAWPSAWDGAHSAFSLWKSLPFLKGQFGSTSFHFFTMPSHSENESLFPVLQKHSASTLVWNSTVGIWSKCRLSPYFSCLYFPPTSPKLVGPDLP